MSTFARRVENLVRRVPRGRVISYGGVAARLGAPRAARAVGRVLASLDAADVPWWRVVNGRGGISARGAGHEAPTQRALLEMEGVRFDRAGRIDLQRFGWQRTDAVKDSGRIKRSVSIAIREPGRTGRILLVRRPANDPELPGAWGLPAASLRPGESWEDAARRATRDKLGVHVRLQGELRRGSIARAHARLRMRLYDASLARGAPIVPQNVADVTQYTDWHWGEASELRPAAARGSLCCRLALAAFAARSRTQGPAAAATQRIRGRKPAIISQRSPSSRDAKR
jgi:methylated-DNA-protein-cysteine methyltransferase-like protein